MPNTYNTNVLIANSFRVGALYSMRSPGDYGCVWEYVVCSRTRKFVTLLPVAEGEQQTVRVGIKVWNNVETCLPLGHYSLSPILRAS